jgi:hypothetical protein
MIFPQNDPVWSRCQFLAVRTEYQRSLQDRHSSIYGGGTRQISPPAFLVERMRRGHVDPEAGGQRHVIERLSESSTVEPVQAQISIRHARRG